ncbi:hypothetical protein ACH5RR_040112 [Cinchona calisaya]|uniref:Non-specific serine/threonine protein kinase n=1 Tax=Cinchona calisaya TaxID=153742 RepID=A0ABD2XTC7_9GENT
MALQVKKFLFVVFLLETCMAQVQNIGRLNLGFQGAQLNWIDNNGMIIVSNNSNFAFGFNPTRDVTLFQLVVIHQGSSTIVWSANRANLIRNSDFFIFDTTGNAYLQSGGSTIWSTNTANKGIAAMELLDSGNLLLVGNDSSIIWQSFSSPTDTLLSNQEFKEGMKLVSNPDSNNLSYSLEIKNGDMILSAGYQPPQPYWAMGKDTRKIIYQDGGNVISATLTANSWRFYDSRKVLLLQFLFSDNMDGNATWVAVLGNDGFITFSILQTGASNAFPTKIPQDQCGSPAACYPFFICYGGNKCHCPSTLSILSSCNPGNVSFCNVSQDSVELVNAGDSLGYFALGFVPPSSKTDLNGCKAFCRGNCSCAAMFFDSSSGNCFLFDQIGSLQGSGNGTQYATYIKVSSSAGIGRNQGGGGSGTNKTRLVSVIILVISTVIVIVGILCARYYNHQMKNKKLLECPKESIGEEEDSFLENLSRMPVRFSYHDLQTATNNFSVKLGQGGFGSVYHGVQLDGTQLAVKKLESIRQGKKEFRAEVCTIGSIHHLHLVRLKGFCAEGNHRLLVYEYMANGSLDRWLFRKDKGEFILDWEMRYSIHEMSSRPAMYKVVQMLEGISHVPLPPTSQLGSRI